MKILKWLDNYFEELLLVILLSVTSVIVFSQVIMRFVFSNSLTWSEELARYLFIWMIYVGVSYGFKKDSHLRVDAIDALLGEKGQIITDIIVNIILFIFMVVMTYFGFNIVIRATRTSAALGIPMSLVYLAPVIGFGMSVIRLIQNTVIKVKKINELG